MVMTLEAKDVNIIHYSDNVSYLHIILHEIVQYYNQREALCC